MLSRIQALENMKLDDQKAILTQLKLINHDIQDVAEELTLENTKAALDAWTVLAKSKKGNDANLASLCALYDRECMKYSLDIFSSLIHAALKKGMLVKDAFKYLDDQRNYSRRVFSTYMVLTDHISKPNNGVNYIRFLRSLIDHSVPMTYIISHLKLKTASGNRFNHIMATDNPEALEDFVNLVFTMRDRGVSTSDLRELVEDRGYNTNPSVIEALCKDQKTHLTSIKKLIMRGFNFPTHCIPTKELKDTVLADILAIHDEVKRLHVLNNAAGKGALGANHPIHKLMKLSRGVRDTKETKVTLAKINAEKDRLENRYIWLISDPSYKRRWSDEYAEFKSIQALISKTLVNNTSFLDKEDSLGQTLRAYLYEKAASCPTIILMMAQRNMIRPRDGQLLATLPDKLLTYVMEGNGTDATRANFISKSLDPMTPLHAFMCFDDAMPGKLQALRAKYSKPVVVTQNKLSMYPAMSAAPVARTDTNPQNVAGLRK